MLINRDQGVHRRVDDAFDPQAAFFERLLGRLAFGDVAQDHRGEPLARDLDLGD